MRTTPLHPDFGLIVHDVDLRDVTKTNLFPEIRQAFEIHSALLFPAQQMDDATHLRLARAFGPLENRDAMATGRDMTFEISEVSNQTDHGVTAPQDLHTLNLQANMLWHTDSTFLPTPALVNILTARTLPASGGGETELASTRVGWASMPAELRARLQDAIIWHRLSHSRARISPDLARLPAMNKWPDRPWRAIWPNPVTGQGSLYIASHSFAIEGMGLEEGQAIIDAAIAHCTAPARVYSHRWQIGDVLLWDERACLHRGRPWNYDEPRRLQSICCSATDADGTAAVRIV
ncbi:TauD/TfdA dioxygenase family protein [Aquicoccus sp. G2-2]|uniref:TauD/TfdA dioxygenase family protein n=1 Tax=Aquicoccus sp. G2-2 TaxID=3092120 RepID=UPI002ADFE9E4|nr:TauD/TfdA family dioxygenase [Aquicoccus sp. G2-2]MEA1114460.1 TauD/TfdA family dioxygenase [Aquicoccus sp. G2-2]